MDDQTLRAINNLLEVVNSDRRLIRRLERELKRQSRRIRELEKEAKNVVPHVHGGFMAVDEEPNSIDALQARAERDVKRDRATWARTGRITDSMAHEVR